MLSNAYQIVSHDTHLSLLGHWGDVVRRERADGGCWELTWRMELPPAMHDRALRRGSRVYLRMGGVPLFAGEMAEPNRSEGEFVARGLSRLAEGFLALSGGLTTSVPDVAIDQAIAAGLPWRRPDSIGATAVTTGDTTEGVNHLHTLLDANADMMGTRWGVDAFGVVYNRTDSSSFTQPRWFCTPDSAYLGISDEDYATHLIGRYRSSTTAYSTATIGNDDAATRWGYRAVPVDLTARGVISLTTARDHLTNLLAKVGPRPGWANGIDVTPNELTTRGGVPANLGTVRAGDTVRVYGVFDENLRPVPHIDFVIGELAHDLGADTLRIEPVGMADRDLSSIIASANDPTAYKG